VFSRLCPLASSESRSRRSCLFLYPSAFRPPTCDLPAIPVSLASPLSPITQSLKRGFCAGATGFYLFVLPPRPVLPFSTIVFFLVGPSEFFPPSGPLSSPSRISPPDPAPMHQSFRSTIFYPLVFPFFLFMLTLFTDSGSHFFIFIT